MECGEAVIIHAAHISSFMHLLESKGRRGRPKQYKEVVLLFVHCIRLVALCSLKEKNGKVSHSLLYDGPQSAGTESPNLVGL